MPLVEPLFYIVAVPTVLLMGISKGGFGAGIMVTPLLALVISPIQSAAIILPLLCVMDLAGLYAYRKARDWRNLKIMLPGALLGILAGALTFRYLDDDAIRLMIGALAIAVPLYRLLAPSAAKRTTSPHIVTGGLSGAASGFTSMIAHSGGPPVQFYLLPQKMDKDIFVGTTVVFFLVVNYVKVIPYGVLGLFTGETLLTGLILSPMAPLGIWLGVRLQQRIPKEAFYRILYGLLFLAGLKLLYDGASGQGWIGF
jgi:uncharacterized membrane protein YfcA